MIEYVRGSITGTVQYIHLVHILKVKVHLIYSSVKANIALYPVLSRAASRIYYYIVPSKVNKEFLTFSRKMGARAFTIYWMYRVHRIVSPYP